MGGPSLTPPLLSAGSENALLVCARPGDDFLDLRGIDATDEPAFSQGPSGFGASLVLVQGPERTSFSAVIYVRIC